MSHTQQLLTQPSPLRAAVAGKVPTLSSPLSSSDTFFFFFFHRVRECFGSERAVTDGLVHPPATGRGVFHYSRLLKAPSKVRTLNTSNDGSSTALLGSLSQCLTALITKNLFLVSLFQCCSPFSPAGNWVIPRSNTAFRVPQGLTLGQEWGAGPHVEAHPPQMCLCLPPLLVKSRPGKAGG